MAGATGRFSHAALDGVLARYVKGGLVSYGALARDTTARAGLDRYVSALATADTAGWTRDEQIAFWINAYNAITLRRVLAAYPVSSITKIRPTLGVLPGNGVWKEKHRVAGLDRSLDDIEHEILRKHFADPRTHFAINCASMSCPPLENRAWTADDLGTRLDVAARRFIRDPRYNRIEPGQPEWRLSRIFEWYAGDFTASAGSVAAYVARYLPEAERSRLPPDKVRVSYLDYDWSLNERASP
ncbi:MAG: DUF547 domain-containing protein [Candidatus Eiseniibacteriota bacterium]